MATMFLVVLLLCLLSVLPPNLSPLLDRVRDRRELPSPTLRRAIRLEAGLSLLDAAQALGVSRQAVAHWEAGTRFPRAQHLQAYAELLRALQREGAA